MPHNRIENQRNGPIIAYAHSLWINFFYPITPSATAIPSRLSGSSWNEYSENMNISHGVIIYSEESEYSENNYTGNKKSKSSNAFSFMGSFHIIILSILYIFALYSLIMTVKYLLQYNSNEFSGSFEFSSNNMEISENKDSVNVALIMAYKRMSNLEQVLNSLATYNKLIVTKVDNSGVDNWSKYNTLKNDMLKTRLINIIVTQTLDPSALEFSLKVDDLIEKVFPNSKRISALEYKKKENINIEIDDWTSACLNVWEIYNVGTIIHTCSMMSSNIDDFSFTRNREKFGSKKSAMFNLEHGINQAFSIFPKLEDLVVLEEDVILSSDIFEFFNAISRLESIGRGKYKTKSIVSDVHYTKSALFSNFPHSGLSTAVNMFRDPELDRFRFSQLKNHWYNLTECGLTSTANNKEKIWSDSSVILRLPFTDLHVFKTFAWKITKSSSGLLSKAFEEMREWQNPNILHPMFDGCWYCENYAYDHIIEVTFAGHTFYAPFIPRVSQNSKGGMTEDILEATNNEIYCGQPISSQEFHEYPIIPRLQ